MALTLLNEKINKLRDKAATLQQDHRTRVDTTRANAGLSSAGKAAALAKNYLDTEKALSALLKDEQTALANKRRELERKLFGQFSTDPSAIIAYRDAQDRVGQLKPDQQDKALSMLRQAQLSGDNTLAAAIIGRALAAGWGNVIDRYTAEHPSEAADLKDLGDIIHFQEDANVQFDTFSAYQVTKPREIERHSPLELEGAANSASTPVADNIYDLARELA